MGLSQFPAAMSRLSASVVNAAGAIRAIQASTGVMSLTLVDRLQTGLREAKTASYEALAEHAKQPVAAEKLMADMGGPATIQEFQAKVMSLETKAAAWNSSLVNHLSLLTGDDLLEVQTATENGISTKHIKRLNQASLIVSDTIRTDPALADLLLAFEEVGA